MVTFFFFFFRYLTDRQTNRQDISFVYGASKNTKTLVGVIGKEQQEAEKRYYRKALEFTFPADASGGDEDVNDGDSGCNTRNYPAFLVFEIRSAVP